MAENEQNNVEDADITIEEVNEENVAEEISTETTEL